MPIPFDNSYARLPERFFARVQPTPVDQPSLIRINQELAEVLRLDAKVLSTQEGVEALGGNRVLEAAEPIALAYAGHQFGHFVPQLGDGRALLLGEVIDRDGIRRDVQLKGSGPTPFSRNGDGRAALGPVLREYVVSEAMHALGIPSTRALAAVSTGEPVYRERLLPGAVLTRVARSHLRVGTFEYFAARQDHEALERLTNYALARHYPDMQSDERPALALLDGVIDAQAKLVARWLGVGFVHGVMNTDNTSIAGETIDYGPCAFLDGYQPSRTFSSIDRDGRYAYSQQPRMAHWNLTRLAEALLPLIDTNKREAIALATERLESFSVRFEREYAAILRAKIGLLEAREDDMALIEALFDAMAAEQADFTLTFRRLVDAASDRRADAFVLDLFAHDEAITAWLADWHHRLEEESNGTDAEHQAQPVEAQPVEAQPVEAQPVEAQPVEAQRVEAQRVETMRGVNPAFIPRNHRIEEMIAAATEGDFAPFERLLQVLQRPYDDQAEADDLTEPPGSEQWSYRTFCGT